MTYICPHMTLSANLLKTVIILFFLVIMLENKTTIMLFMYNIIVNVFITVPFDNNSQ